VKDEKRNHDFRDTEYESFKAISSLIPVRSPMYEEVRAVKLKEVLG
jgi:hypothetical protein